MSDRFLFSIGGPSLIFIFAALAMVWPVSCQALPSTGRKPSDVAL
jgi:hypothetical protein